MKLKFAIFALLVLAWSGANAAGPASITGVASVVDGDTIEIHGARIRLHGIDAPESAQMCRRSDGSSWRCGQKAALALQDHIGGKPVTCARRDTDRYGRLVGQCSVAGADINAWLVTQGWAVAYRRYSTEYVKAEVAAQRAGAGIWSSTFVMPWDWRRGQRMESPMVKTCAADKCLIKGNISRRGERIYHVPGRRYYEATKISESKGERWFCTEAEARAAGWRRSRQ